MSSHVINTGRVFVSKPWGYEDWIVNTELYCGKLLFIKKNMHLSLHFHRLKTETFYQNSGEVIIEYYDDPSLDQYFTSWDKYQEIWNDPHSPIKHQLESVHLTPGDSFQIPVGRRHTVKALLDSQVFEFSTQHFDDDSIRVLQGMSC